MGQKHGRTCCQLFPLPVALKKCALYTHSTNRECVGGGAQVLAASQKRVERPSVNERKKEKIVHLPEEQQSGEKLP